MKKNIFLSRFKNQGQLPPLQLHSLHAQWQSPQPTILTARLGSHLQQPRHVASLYQLLKQERGSATVESMLVFPVIISVIIIMMLASVYAYQLVYVQYISSTAAERVSYSWDNREREFHTGQADEELQYGLYEHEHFIMLLNEIIPISTKQRGYSIQVTDQITPYQYSGKLIEDKLSKARAYITESPSGATGSIELAYKGLLPTVKVSLDKSISPLFWQQNMLLPSPSYTSHYTIHAPTQFIRNVDLFMYYVNKLSTMTNEQRQKWKSSGGKAVKSFSS